MILRAISCKIKDWGFLYLDFVTRVHGSSCRLTSAGLPVGSSSVRIPLLGFGFRSRARGVGIEKSLLPASSFALPSPSVRFSLSLEKSSDFPVESPRRVSSSNILPLRLLPPLVPVGGGHAQSSNAALSLAPALSPGDPASSRRAHGLASRVGCSFLCALRPDSGGTIDPCPMAGRVRSEAAQFLEIFLVRLEEPKGLKI